jgi:hypothetical protein
MTSIPSTGLEMTCEYCGLTRPVPDADKRRKAMEKAERQRRKAEEDARRRAAQRERDRERSRDERRSARGWRLFGVLVVLLPLAITGISLYSSGLFNSLIGDPGADEFDRLSRELVAQGYEPVGPSTVKGARATMASLFLPMEQGSCYVLGVSSGVPITRIQLMARRTMSVAPNHVRGILSHCPARRVTLKAMVHLAEDGRFTWGLFRRSAPAADQPRPTRRVERRRPRRGRGQRRRRRRLRGRIEVTPSPVRPADRQEHFPPEAQPPDDWDD